MSEPKYREWILETIDSLRSRKARPDLERICRMVRRRHGSDPDRTRTELEKLIEEQTVLKVSYKGSISYRNAAKVQRKSRKKSEFTAAGGAEAARERTKLNNGDSAHSFTDQEEGEEDSEPSPDPRTHTSAEHKHEPPSSHSSGNGSFSCGATTGCAVGSGWKEEKASASTEKGLGQQGAGECPAHGSILTTSGEDGTGGGEEPDSQNKTCPGSVSSLPHRHKQAHLKAKLRVGGTKSASNPTNSDLGDRLVASVRSLSEKSLRGSSAAATRGCMKPLGLKEILGYLSSQERLSEEKLTRGKVRVVMEREVARGRLRRTRCGNITLPLRGSMVEEPAPNSASAHREANSALQDAVKKSPPSLQENEPVETASEEQDENEEEDELRSSDEDQGLSPVAMTTEPCLTDKNPEDAEIQTASNQEDKELDSVTSSVYPPAQGASPSLCSSAHSEESIALPDQLHLERQDQVQPDGISNASSDLNSGLDCTNPLKLSLCVCLCVTGFGGSSGNGESDYASFSHLGLECKTEVGMSSCMFTPIASPRDSGLSEECLMNGGVGNAGFMKPSGTPVDWTVSDVVSYFLAAGFPEQAVAFRTQEIDGKSLLLMQRNDVLTGLSIRLGPALKIYERHVKVLQRAHFEDDDC